MPKREFCIEHFVVTNYPQRIEYEKNLLSPLFDKNSVVLDAGCGYGNSHLNLTMVKELIGIDLNKNAVQQNSDINKKIVGDLEKLDIGTEKCDLAMSIDVVEHIKNPELFINGVSRVINPGGHLFISTPNRISIFGFLTSLLPISVLKWFSKLLLRRQTDNEVHFYKMNTVNTLTKNLRKNDFHDIRVILLHSLPSTKKLRIAALPDFIIGRSRLIPHFSGKLICIATKH